MFLVAEKRFRKLNSPELLMEVFLGVRFHNGVPVRHQQTEAAA
jgi:hypothetical protein